VVLGVGKNHCQSVQQLVILLVLGWVRSREGVCHVLVVVALVVAVVVQVAVVVVHLKEGLLVLVPVVVPRLLWERPLARVGRHVGL